MIGLSVGRVGLRPSCSIFGSEQEFVEDGEFRAVGNWLDSRVDDEPRIHQDPGLARLFRVSTPDR